METTSPAVPLPLYQCHKQVRAAKILDMRLSDMEGRTVLILENPPSSVEVFDMWCDKHKVAIGGYYVQYTDGYISYSPAKAFEEGYARVPADYKDRVRLEHADLNAKITKLEAYLDNPANEFVTGLSLLHDQLNAMRRYAHILTQRIAGF